MYFSASSCVTFTPNCRKTSSACSRETVSNWISRSGLSHLLVSFGRQVVGDVVEERQAFAVRLALFGGRKKAVRGHAGQSKAFAFDAVVVLSPGRRGRFSQQRANVPSHPEMLSDRVCEALLEPLLHVLLGRSLLGEIDLQATREPNVLVFLDDHDAQVADSNGVTMSSVSMDSHGARRVSRRLDVNGALLGVRLLLCLGVHVDQTCICCAPGSTVDERRRRSAAKLRSRSQERRVGKECRSRWS